jgi:ADP-heptose:LPS heptosyltransferase
MDVARMRRLDRWLGVPVCLVLTFFRKLLGRRTPGRAFVPQRILFVKLAEQGSTVLAYGAIRRAIERVGRENVFFLLFAENRPILNLMNLIPAANVITIDAKGPARALLGALAAVWRLRRARIDAAVDLEFFARSSAALCFLSGARWRAGYHAFGGEASYRGDLMTHRVSFNPYLHTCQTFQLLVEALDWPADAFPQFGREPPPIEAPALRFQPHEEELAEVRAMVDGLLGRSAQGHLILLNANASDLIPLRRWPSERYVDLARRILTRYPDACVAFTGSPREAQATELLVREVGSDRCVSMAGRTTLRQLLVLCCLAEVLVTNDSGPAHFASLTPVDVVVLFGPETPRLFAAVSPRTHPLWAGLACSPCINAFNNRASACRDNLCMQSIGVEQVFHQVCRLYMARRTEGRRLLPGAEPVPMRRVA